MTEDKVFLATSESSISRAERGNGAWKVSQPLQGQRLNCLASDPLHPQRLYAGTHGDGVLSINDDYAHLVYPNNAPPYLTYDLVRDHLDPSIHEHLVFNVHWEGHPEEVQHLLIGTDGVADFHQAADRCIAGTSKQVGPLSQFWQRDQYFTNPPAIRQCLKQVNRTVLRVEQGQQDAHKEIGLLPDDTTFIVMRRKRG